MDLLSIVKYILIAIYSIICVALIILVMKQNKEDNGASGTIMGASANNFYEKNKGKTNEGKMKIATVILMIVFALMTVGLGILYVV